MTGFEAGTIVNLLPLAARRLNGPLEPLNVLLRLDNAAARWPAFVVTSADGIRFDAAAVIAHEIRQFGWVVEGAGNAKTLDLTDTSGLTPGLKGALERALAHGIGWSIVRE